MSNCLFCYAGPPNSAYANGIQMGAFLVREPAKLDEVIATACPDHKNTAMALKEHLRRYFVPPTGFEKVLDEDKGTSFHEELMKDD